MFRQFAGSIPGGANTLFLLHPAELTALLEQAWALRLHNPALGLGHPDRRSNVPELPDYWLNEAPSPRSGILPPAEANRQRFAGRVRWDHLIYAYMIENTRMYEVFRRVLEEFLHGEKLGVPNAASQHWLRNTEELFYRDPAPFYIGSLSSHLRRDLRATRRNAYHRMFGMDLNHGADDNQPYPYRKVEAANTAFVTTFEELLREVWVGITNVNNSSGSNETDDAKIATLAERLHDMLRSRRQNGNLSREEFAFVSALSWFHLTLEFNSPIIEALRAEAEGAEQRLFKVAERVGLPAHGLSESYFEIADPISRILTQIEIGTYNSVAAVPALYTPATGGPETDMRTIITHWSIITGHDVKAGKVSAT